MESALGVALTADLDAQWTFLGCLVPYLDDHGTMTREEIQGAGVSLFKLPLEDNEVVDLLELARRQGLVCAQRAATPMAWRLKESGVLPVEVAKYDHPPG